MKIAGAQINPVTGDLKGNYERILSSLEQATGKADLLVLPETAITGYCMGDLIEDASFVRENKKLLMKLAKETSKMNGLAAAVGFVDYDSTAVNNDARMRKYNAAAVMQGGQIVGVTYKSLLANYNYFDDKRHYTPGVFTSPIEILVNKEKVPVGFSICEDMWDESYQKKPIEELTTKGAKLIVNLNASPFHPTKRDIRADIIKRHVARTGLPFVYINSVGVGDNGKNIIPFDGQSMFYNAKGELVGLGKSFQEEMMIVDIENAKPIDLPKTNRDAQTFDAISMSLKEYAKHTGFKRAIIPLSGGVDSAVSAAISVDALGRENVVAYNLPSKFNTDTTKGIAKHIAETLGIEYKIVPIQTINDQVLNDFSNSSHPIKDKIAKENLQARIRGLLMMLESNDTSSLLVSCGNKTEIALGYSTLYGDMCGGVSIIGDVPKSGSGKQPTIYTLARHANKKFEGVFPEELFIIKASAELSEGQYDPFDYPTVAPIVDAFIEDRNSVGELTRKFRERNLGEEFTKDVYEKYDAEAFEELVLKTYNLFRKTPFKRMQGAPIVAVTDRPLGFSLREPIINKWNGEL